MSQVLLSSFKLRGVLLFLFLALSLNWLLGCASPSLEQGQLRSKLEGLEGVTPSLLALPQAFALDELEAHIPTQQLIDDYENTAKIPTLHPQVSALLRWKASRLRADNGDLKGSIEALDQLGFLTRWHIIGPFPNEGMEGFETLFSPEEGLKLNDFAADGRFPDLAWRSFESKTQGGYIPFGALVEPLDQSVAYAATDVELASETDAILWLSVDGLYQVWLNGVLVGKQEKTLGGLIDRDGFHVHLKGGRNTLVIKVASDDLQSGFFARLTTPKRTPLLTSSAAPSLGAALSSDPSAIKTVAAPLAELQTLLEASEETPESARNQAWLAYLTFRMHPRDPSRHFESIALGAIAQAPNDPIIAALAQELVEEPWRRRQILETALAAHPKDPTLLLLRAQQLIDSERDDQAERLNDIFTRIKALDDDSTSAELLLIDYLSIQGLEQSAYERAEALNAEFDDLPATLEALMWRAEHIHNYPRQIEVLSKLLKQQSTHEVLRHEHATLSFQRGEHTQALKITDQGLAIRPYSLTLLGLRVEILTAMQRDEEAQETLQVALKMLPTSADLWEQYGNWLIHHDRTDEALPALNRALELEPQNAELKRFINYLNPNIDSFETPYLLSSKTLAKMNAEASFPPEEDYAYLLDQIITLVHPNGLSSTYHQTVYKVLTETGAKSLQRLPIYYTPGEDLLKVDLVRVDRADGTSTTVFKSHEYSVSDERYRMYYDRRQIVLDLPDLQAGDRVEVRYQLSEVSQTNMFNGYFGDLWFLQGNVPKQLTRYTLITPQDREFYFRLPDAPGPQFFETADVAREQKIYQLEQHNVPAVMNEARMPGFAEVASYLHVTTFKEWGEVAQWYWHLAKDQWVVDDEIKAKVAELTKDLTDRRTIVEKIHNYVVKNTRYVALEFGIHGYKPYRTTLCFRRRFGDCKDKASLIKVMLEEAGVPANIVLVRTRRNGDIDLNPPSLSIFDHAIAYVPEFDLFLDGTAEFSGTNELPAMDQGITVLIVKDQGGYTLQKTPIQPSSANSIKKRYSAILSLSKDTVLSGTANVSGEFAPNLRQRFESKEVQKPLFQSNLSNNFPNAQVSLIEFSDLDDLEAPVSYRFKATVTSLLKPIGGDWQLYPLGHGSKLVTSLAPNALRKQALTIEYPFSFEHEVVYTLPPELRVDTLPKPTQLQTPFGILKLETTQVKGEIKVTSRFELSTRHVKLKDYPEFRAFIVAADRALDTPIKLKQR